MTNRTFVVTGGNTGIGRAIAQALAAAEHHVVITSRNQDRGVQAVAGIQQAIRHANVEMVIGDLSTIASTHQLADTLLERFPNIAVLINNAGGPAPGSHTDHTIQDFRNAVELSMISSIDMTARVLPGMRERGFGRVINITSIAVKQPIVGLIMSNTARTGLVGYMKTVATEVAADGVTVNNICPGLILTDRMYELLGEDATIDMKPPEGGGLPAELVGSIPMKRMGKPEEVGALAAFLASDKASFITGVSILIDGGAYKGLH